MFTKSSLRKDWVYKFILTAVLKRFMLKCQKSNFLWKNNPTADYTNYIEDSFNYFEDQIKSTACTKTAQQDWEFLHSAINMSLKKQNSK